MVHNGEDMSNKFLWFIVQISILWLFSFYITSCTSDKIPITSSSGKARELFIEARDLADKYHQAQARELLHKAIELDSNFALAYYQLSALQTSNKEFLRYLNLAKSHIEKISDGEKWLILALDARVNGFPDKERDYLERIIADYPHDERGYSFLGNFYQFVLQDYKTAETYYLKALEINPEFSIPYNELGYNYRSLGDYSRAEESFKKYIKLVPDSPNPYDSYAELLLKMGEYDVSIEMYEKALTIDPYFINPHVGIATNLMLKRDYKEARRELKEFYLKARDDDERRFALVAMAIALVDEGKIEEAIMILKKRFDLAKSNKDTSAMAGDMTLMGFLAQEIDAYDQSRAYFEESARLLRISGLDKDIKDRLSRGYLFNRSRLALFQGDIDQAKVYARKYEDDIKTANLPQQVRALHTLKGLIAFYQNSYDAAIEEFKQSDQQNAYNLFWLAASYEAANDKENAKVFYKMAANMNTIFDIAYATVRTKSELKLAELEAALAD